MSTEVKIVYADVENQLGEMTGAVNLLNPKAELPISGNTLDVVTKFNELSLKLDQLLVKYQTLSTGNIQTTSASIDFMEESDQKISAAMQCTVNGTSVVAR
ncbi:MAG: YwqI/YxiC family protein [Psychrobacillus psychrotolerans]